MIDMAQKPRVLSGYKDLAAFLGVSTRTIQRHLKSIPVSRIGKRVMILEADLVTWIQTHADVSIYKKNKYDSY